MELKNIQRKDRRKISIGIKITKTHSEFLKKHNISPTALFLAALEELMKKKITEVK